MNKSDFILKNIENYYAKKINEYGATPMGVDWNNYSSQQLRFINLLKIIDSKKRFTINDIGCGYGALYEFMRTQYDFFKYFGFDISEAMIEKASANFRSKNVSFLVSCSPKIITDYSVASGIFNVKLKTSNKDWLEYVKETLNVINNKSSKGFSFNCLSCYSDKDKKRKDLYYADPLFLFDHCKKKFSKNVALLHDYNLYEFTILVKK
jgi:SAM-dependent methyltransferase